MRAEAKELSWLCAHLLGETVRQIAQAEGCSRRSIHLGIRRARVLEAKYAANGRHAAPHEPRLVMLYPITPLVPASPCPHHAPIRAGSVICCGICHQSGLDGLHPALRRDPATDPRPEPRPKPSATTRPSRKQRRAARARQAAT